jgi:dihydroorotate dehydrogenase electron transfer subunit
MTTTTQTARKGDYRAAIAFNDCIARDIYRMGLLFTGPASDAYARLQPGQFAELDLSRTGIPPADKIPAHLEDKLQRQIILRRPFSFSNAVQTEKGVVAELIYAALGPATLRMTTVQPGDTMDVIGPLGRGFQVHPHKQVALLVGGGLGTPPIVHLARKLHFEHPSMKTHAFVGARDYKTLPFDVQCTNKGLLLPPFEDCQIPYTIATDDGSAGHRGLVTECLTQWLDENRDIPTETIALFACGPEPMLAALAALAAQQRIDCQVSLERRMACGFNLCQGCAVECRVPGTRETMYRMCCQDGPVFPAKDVIFAS